MLKKLSAFFAVFCAMFLYFAVNASAHMPVVVINDTVIDTSDGFYFESGSTYIKPEMFTELFGVDFSFDSQLGLCTTSTPVRKVECDIISGDIHITDTNSFSSVFEHTDNLYKNGYLKLRALCTSLGMNIWYEADTHTAYVKKRDYSVGFYNKSGMVIASMNGKFGIVNSQGSIVLPFVYDSITNYENSFIYRISLDGKYGLVDNSGLVVTDVIYTSIEYVSDNEIYLYSDEKKGMCNLKGDIVIPVEYEEIAYSGNEVAMVKKSGQWLLFSFSNGEYLNELYDEVYKITEGVHADSHTVKGYCIAKGGKWGFIDSFGNVMIPLIYDGLDKFDNLGRARMVQDSKMGIVECSGQVIIPAAYEFIYPFGSQKVTVAQLGKMHGALKLDGTIAIPFVYDYIYSFNDADVTIAYKDNVFMVVNTKGVPVSESCYSYAEEFKNGIALVYKEDCGYGYINYACKEIIDCVHSEVKQGTSNSVLLKKEDKWALFSPDGKNISGYIYSEADEFENGLSAVSIDVNGEKRYGYISSYGEEIIPFIYSSAQKFKYGRAVVSKENAYGIIDIDGQTVIPFEYAGFVPSYDYNVIAAADFNGKWGLISFMNEKITEFEYDYISEFNNNYAVVMKGDKYGVITVSGANVTELIYASATEALDAVKNN